MSYITTMTLRPGTTYSFKVSARNSVGVSQLSTFLPVLAATTPDAPVSLLNSTTNSDKVVLTWSLGRYDGGSPVIDY